MTTLAAHDPLTPVGRPVTVTPVAPVVLYVMLVIAVLIHLACELVPPAEVKVIVLSGVTVIVPVALTAPQPPVRGML